MFNKLFSDLTQSDKNQLLITVFITLIMMIIVLFAFLVSRGQDVDYFKSRIDVIDQRSLYMDQKIDKVNEKLADNRKELNDIRRRDEEQQKDLEEYRKWIEYWKSLPHLPKPPQGVPRR